MWRARVDVFHVVKDGVAFSIEVLSRPIRTVLLRSLFGLDMVPISTFVFDCTVPKDAFNAFELQQMHESLHEFPDREDVRNRTPGLFLLEVWAIPSLAPGSL